MDERGFGLVEAIVVCSIPITIAIAIGGLITSSIAATTVASETTQAEQCAADQVERVRPAGSLMTFTASAATATGGRFGEYASRVLRLRRAPPVPRAAVAPSIDTYTTAFFREVTP